MESNHQHLLEQIYLLNEEKGRLESIKTEISNQLELKISETQESARVRRK